MIKNIIKRVIVGVLIALILSFLGSCNVKADIIRTDTWYNNMKRPYGGQLWNWTSATNRVEVNGLQSMGYGTEVDDNYWGDTLYKGNISIGQYGVSFGVLTDTNYYHGYLYHFAIFLGSTRTLSIYDSSNSIHVGSIFSDMDYQASRLTKIDCGPFYLENSFKYCYVLETIMAPAQSGDWVFGRVSADSTNGTIGLFGYDSSNLGVFNAVTNATLNSIIDSKGFATQSSVNQVNNTMNNVNNSIQNQTTQQHQDAQQTQQKLDDINNTMQDDNTSDISTDAISNGASSIATNNVISDLITLPVDLFTAILNSIDAGCFQYSLGSLFGTELILPCINLENILGSGLYHTIDVLISGLFVYYISRKMIKIFNELSMLEKVRGME